MLGLLAVSPGSICYESCLSSLSLWFWKNFSSPVACRHSATTSVLGSWIKVDDQSLLVKLLSFNIVLSTQKYQIYIYVCEYIYIYIYLSCTMHCLYQSAHCGSLNFFFFSDSKNDSMFWILLQHHFSVSINWSYFIILHFLLIFNIF